MAPEFPCQVLHEKGKITVHDRDGRPQVRQLVGPFGKIVDRELSRIGIPGEKLGALPECRVRHSPSAKQSLPAALVSIRGLVVKIAFDNFAVPAVEPSLVFTVWKSQLV
jgi:hypothetical protein